MDIVNVTNDEKRSVPVLTVIPPLFLIEAEMICWWCGEPIKVVGIVARRVAILADGDDAPSAEDADDFFLLTYVKSLPESLISEIQAHSPTFSFSGSTTARQPCFANVCAYCNLISAESQ